MKLFWGSILLGAVILLYMWPGVLTLVISCGQGAVKKPEKGKTPRLFVLAMACALNLAFYFFLHRVFAKRWDLLQTAKDILYFRFSYQDICYFSISLFVYTAFAVVLGFVLRRILSVSSGKGSERMLSERKSPFLFLSLSGIGLVILSTYYFSITGVNHMMINEVYAGGQTVLLGDGRKVSDYIELYNNGILSCELDHIYLSDDGDGRKKLEISFCEVPAGGYMLVVLKESGAFALKKEGGESVVLSDSSGRVLDQVTPAVTSHGYSYARRRDGLSEWGIFTCTPEMPNTAGVAWVSEPELSHKGGFYPEPFELEITSEPGTAVYYTVDGSVPTMDSFLYTAPINVYDRSEEENVYRSVRNVTKDWLDYEPDETPVDKAFVLRAIAVSNDGSTSETVTATFFVGMDNYRQSGVVSLVADPSDLWGDDGIYVTGREYDAWYLGGQAGEEPVRNYNRHGREYEVEASFEFFSEETTFAQNIGLRVTGASNREDPMKNFTLYARKEYDGSSTFDEEIFPGISSHKLTLRQGYANAFCQTLVRDRDIATQGYRCVSVFLNGEFWYNTNLLEKYDACYFEEHYGIAKDNIVVYNQGGVGEGTEEDLALRHGIYDFLDTHDMSDQDSYEAFGEIVDLQSYIDYMCVNIYMDNMDFSDSGNVIMWRSRDEAFGEYEDGRWRWALYDLDAMGWGDHVYWGIGSQQKKNSFSLQPRFVEYPINQQTAYQALKNNPDFCRQFVLTFMDLSNTDFRYENVSPKIDEYDRHLQESAAGTEISWDKEYYEEFFADRASYITVYLGEEFGLSGSREQVALSVNDPEGGTVVLNTVELDLASGSWSGTYYTDYPVTVEAESRPGYVFVGWEGEVVTEENRVEVPVREGGISLQAVFQKIGF